MSLAGLRLERLPAELEPRPERVPAAAVAGCAVVAPDFYAFEGYEDILPAFYESQPELAVGEVETFRAAGAAA